MDNNKIIDDLIEENSVLKTENQQLRLEVQRIRKIITDYCEIENHYSQAWDNDAADALLLREDWQKAWQALEDEALRTLMNTLDDIYDNNN